MLKLACRRDEARFRLESLSNNAECRAWRVRRYGRWGAPVCPEEAPVGSRTVWSPVLARRAREAMPCKSLVDRCRKRDTRVREIVCRERACKGNAPSQRRSKKPLSAAHTLLLEERQQAVWGACATSQIITSVVSLSPQPRSYSRYRQDGPLQAHILSFTMQKWVTAMQRRCRTLHTSFFIYLSRTTVPQATHTALAELPHIEFFLNFFELHEYT